MDLFMKAAAITLISLILWVLLSKQNKEMALLLSILACCLIFTSAISYFQPVIDFFEKLETIGNLDHKLIEILLKAACVGVLSEVIGLLCKDAGNAAVGKTLQLLASAVILWLAIPLLNELMELAEDVLGVL